MGRQARAKKARRQLLGGDQPTIELRNPNRDSFGPFIVGNHEKWYEMAMTELAARAPDKAAELAAIVPLPGETYLQHAMAILNEARTDNFVVEEDVGVGKEVVICGAGPSLKETAAKYCTPDRDVIGCNSAVTWLAKNGHHVTHAFSVDQTNEMLIEWYDTPDVEHLIATSVHVHLTEWLLKNKKRVRFFHNFVGLQGAPVEYEGESMGFEDWIYSALFPSTVRTGSGLNSVNRAMDLALYMGYEKIYVLGMDCAIRMKSPPPDNAPMGSPAYLKWLGEETVMHANGDSSIHNGASPITLIGEVDGITFLSKPDLLPSAVWGVKVEQIHKGRIEIVGSPLIDALRGKSDSFLSRLPTLVDANGKALKIA